ncbi:MAG: oligopeptidase A, partial [Candidatus Pseudothioglobus sp.]
MKSKQTPNFKPKDIVLKITQVVKDGISQSALASKGNDWESVVSVLDKNEHLIGKEMSVNSHLNAVMFSEEFNKEYEKTLPIISNYYSDLGANEDLYKA